MATPPRDIALPHPSHYYTPCWSPDSKKILYSDTNLKVWVLDVASGQTKVVGNDPWMVPERTINPVWSPDSKWVAYASRLKSLYHAIFISNVETGEARQVTDALADSVWPAWDASGTLISPPRLSTARGNRGAGRDRGELVLPERFRARCGIGGEPGCFQRLGRSVGHSPELHAGG